MKTVVIIPGGFHPFHAGHFDLYQQAKAAFPGADVYVAATDDTSERPFPFEVKEKLAKLAGVDPGHFVRVKSPFAATEITDHYDPNDTVLVFVKSDKNAKGGPSPEGPFPAEPDPQTGRLPLVTRGPNKGKPVSDRLQYYRGNEKNLKPMSRHSYLAYLKTKPFMGMTSGSEIRQLWPNLDDDGKRKIVQGMYPRTKGNDKLADTVIKMLDLAIMGMAEGLPVTPVGPVVPRNPTQQQRQQPVYAPPLDRKPPSPAAIIHISPTKEDQDYVEEKWSAKYKRSINCSNPRGFSQRAHCAGRKKNEDMAEAVHFDPVSSKAKRDVARQQGLRPTSPQRLFSELADMLKISVGQLTRLVQNIPGFPPVHSRGTSTHGSKGYYDLVAFKRWVIDNNVREKIAAKRQQAADKKPLDERCWDTHRQVGMKKKGGRMVPDCVPK